MSTLLAFSKAVVATVPLLTAPANEQVNPETLGAELLGQTTTFEIVGKTAGGACTNRWNGGNYSTSTVQGTSADEIADKAEPQIREAVESGKLTLIDGSVELYCSSNHGSAGEDKRFPFPDLVTTATSTTQTVTPDQTTVLYGETTFGTDSMPLDLEDGKAIGILMGAAAAMFDKDNSHVVVIGHADKRKSRITNPVLAEGRAENTAAAIAATGINADNIEILDCSAQFHNAQGVQGQVADPRFRMTSIFVGYGDSFDNLNVCQDGSPVKPGVQVESVRGALAPFNSDAADVIPATPRTSAVVGPAPN